MTSSIVSGSRKKFDDVGKGRRKVALFPLPTDPVTFKKNGVKFCRSTLMILVSQNQNVYVLNASLQMTSNT